MKEKRHFYYYLNHKHLINEIEQYGYVISAKKLAVTYLAIIAGCLGAAFLFNLAPIGYFILLITAVVTTPFLLIYSYKALYEQRRFSDASLYIEKMLYYFKASGKVLDTLEDASKIFHEGVMKNKIDEAIDFIKTANTDNVDEKALKIIETEFPSDRIRTLHKFILNVEKHGGNPDLGIEMLLEERDRWTDNVVLAQQANKHIKTIFIIVEVLIIAICLGFIYVPQYMKLFDNDISTYFMVRSASLGLVISVLLVYTKLLEKMGKNWLEKDVVKTDKELEEQYNNVVNYNKKKEMKKCFLFSLIPAVVTTVLLLLLQSKTCLVIGTAITLFVFFSYKIDNVSRKKTLERDIIKAFPSWLLNVALFMQMDNVPMSIVDSYAEAPGILKPEIKKLLLALDETPNSPVPFNDFMKDFNMAEVHEAMSAMYSIMHASGSDMEHEFREIIKRNNKMIDKAQKMKNEDNEVMNEIYLFIPGGVGFVHLLVDSLAIMICILNSVATMV